MNDLDTKQFVFNIINQAQEGKFIKFQYIGSWKEFIYYLRQKQSTKLIIKALKISAKKLFTDYCRNVIAGISDVNKLLAYTKMLDIIDFYKKDLDTLNQMLDDYDTYLGDGHFLYSLFGGERYL